MRPQAASHRISIEGEVDVVLEKIEGEVDAVFKKLDFSRLRSVYLLYDC